MRLGFPSIVLIFALAVVLGAGTTLGAIPTAERNALIAIYNAAGGPGWNDTTNWLGPPGSECTWAGVGCDPALSSTMSEPAVFRYKQSMLDTMSTSPYIGTVTFDGPLNRM